MTLIQVTTRSYINRYKFITYRERMQNKFYIERGGHFVRNIQMGFYSQKVNNINGGLNDFK